MKRRRWGKRQLPEELERAGPIDPARLEDGREAWTVRPARISSIMNGVHCQISSTITIVSGN